MCLTWQRKKEKSLFIEYYLCTQQNFEAKVNSFCMGYLLIKINTVQTQLWEKPIYKVLSCFRKQHVLFRLFTRNIYLGKKEINQTSQNNSFPLLFYDIKKLRFCWDRLILRLYVTIAYSPFPDNLETFLCGFYYPIVWKKLFLNITLLRLHVKIWFDLIASDFLIEKHKKQSST